jgi:acyl-coenzyme A synthetase/AMP-(fatty) acid ligase
MCSDGAGDVCDTDIQKIPRTPSGKMLRREMRDQFHARLKKEGKAKL